MTSKMKALYVFILLVALLNQKTSAFKELKTGVNGGLPCGGCTFLLAMIEQIAEYDEKNITDVVTHFCAYLPGLWKSLCDIIVDIWGPAIIEKLERKETPDVICYSLGICHVDPGQQYCHLFPEPQGGMDYAILKSRKMSKVIPYYTWYQAEKTFSICDLPIINYICKTIEKFFNQELPVLDIDGDKYSTIEGMRGDSWRGKDCNDFNENIYPGRRSFRGDQFIDSNCNGISGKNVSSSKTYEEELCSGTSQYGLLYIGDSIGAHFHLPSQWITASEMNMNIYKRFPFIIENELDWPELSFATGYKNLSWPTISGYTDSIYLRLREHNLCNHRDYQNVAVNGADSVSNLNYIKSISRNKTVDKPVIAIFALMGNDVCTRYFTSADDLISPKKFQNNILNALIYLEKNLPPNSHVILMGLVDGSFIYPTMAKHIHPIGQLNNDVTYDNFFEWLNCMRLSPCSGWQNRNNTIRKATTQRANELSNVLKEIVSEVKYRNFQLHYEDNPMQEVFNAWQNAGNELWKVLEPVDSLHPVQKLQPYMTEAIWQKLLKSNILGKTNPNNELIKKIFGDQGGH